MGAQAAREPANWFGNLLQARSSRAGAEGGSLPAFSLAIDGTGPDVVRIALGLLLLIAAFLHADEWAPQRAADSGLLDNRRLLPDMMVDFKRLFGLWLFAQGCSKGRIPKKRLSQAKR